MSNVVSISTEPNEVIKSLEEALDKAKQSPHKAVVICMMEDQTEGFIFHMFSAGSLLHRIAMAARLLYRTHQTVDSSTD